jgi:uncharacterized protein with FMN-binding domain
MKKIQFIILSSALVFALAGCGAKSQSTSSDAASASTTATTTGSVVVYKDGIYDSKTKNKKNGYDEAIVTIKEGKIQDIELKRLDDKSQEVNYDFFDGAQAPNLKKYRQDLSKAMLEKQSPNVDAISGATLSSTGWKQSAADALAKASKQ